MEFEHSKNMAPGLVLYPHMSSGVHCWKFIPPEIVNEWKRVGSQPRVLRNARVMAKADVMGVWLVLLLTRWLALGWKWAS
jgi:hypothetical protein